MAALPTLQLAWDCADSVIEKHRDEAARRLLEATAPKEQR